MIYISQARFFFYIKMISSFLREGMRKMQDFFQEGVCKMLNSLDFSRHDFPPD